eukprot:Gb_22959 [translate_table: standard]
MGEARRFTCQSNRFIAPEAYSKTAMGSPHRLSTSIRWSFVIMIGEGVIPLSFSRDFVLIVLHGRLANSSLDIMGGDPVMTEPTVLKMEEDMKGLLEKASLLDFFRKFTGFSESISLQVVDSWDEGRVKVDGLKFTISEHLISEVSVLPMEGEVSGIAKTLGQGGHSSDEINVSLFLLKSVEKSIKSVKSGKGKLPLHQGLLNLLFQFETSKRSSVAMSLKGNLLKVSGPPVSKAQLLLGPTSSAQKLNVVSSNLEEEEDSPSEDVGGRRSTRLQKKTAEKVKIIDYINTSDNEKEEKEAKNPTDMGISRKGLDPVEEVKDSAKVSCDTQNVIKELKSHLKILNGLGGSLTSTCACLNVLALEITNYLKEVVSKLKELNPE